MFDFLSPSVLRAWGLRQLGVQQKNQSLVPLQLQGRKPSLCSLAVNQSNILHPMMIYEIANKRGRRRYISSRMFELKTLLATPHCFQTIQRARKQESWLSGKKKLQAAFMRKSDRVCQGLTACSVHICFGLYLLTTLIDLTKKALLVYSLSLERDPTLEPGTKSTQICQERLQLPGL